MSTWDLPHYCEFCTCVYAQKGLQIVPSLGQGPALLYACKKLNT